MEGHTGDILLPLYDVSDPSPSSWHDDGPHIVVVVSAEKFSTGDGLRPEYVQYPSQVTLDVCACPATRSDNAPRISELFCRLKIVIIHCYR